MKKEHTRNNRQNRQKPKPKYDSYALFVKYRQFN